MAPPQAMHAAIEPAHDDHAVERAPMHARDRQAVRDSGPQLNGLPEPRWVETCHGELFAFELHVPERYVFRGRWRAFGEGGHGFTDRQVAWCAHAHPDVLVARAIWRRPSAVDSGTGNSPAFRMRAPTERHTRAGKRAVGSEHPPAAANSCS